MQVNHPATLTADDHAVLERLMCTLSGSQEPVAALARRKLEAAVIIPPEATPDDLATSDRQVRYSVNDALEAERLLTWDRPQQGSSAISLQQPLGLALLGLRTGQSIAFSTEAGIERAVVRGVSAVSGNSARKRAPSNIRLFAAAISRHAKTTLSRLQQGRTEATLMRLSDATLKDIGITRREIPRVARDVAGLTPPALTSQRNPGGSVKEALRRGRQEMARQLVARPQPFSVGQMRGQSLRSQASGPNGG